MTLHDGSRTGSTNTIKQSSQIPVETILTETCHLFLTLTWLIQCIFFHPTSLRSIFILSSVLCLDFTSGLFPSGFPTSSSMHLSSPLYVPRALPFDPPWVDHLNNILWDSQNMKFSTMEFCLTSWYCLPLMSVCFPKHPLLDHRWSMFSS